MSKRVNKGGKEFRELIERSGLSVRDMGEALGISPAYVSKLSTGDRTPGLALALDIERYYRIPAHHWGERVKEDEFSE